MLEIDDVVVSGTEWTKKNNVFSFRIWDGYLFRKEISDAFYGGYQIQSIRIGVRWDWDVVANEWLAE